jgi:uncharacterized protein
MYRLFCLALLAVNIWFGPAVAANTFPALTGRVVDAAAILSPAAEARLNQELEAFEKEHPGQQVVVATVPTLGGQAIEEYGYQLGRFWGIGDKDKNTGAILLVAPADRQVRIEVGYGLEGTLTDALSRAIIERDILPSFKAGRMDEGVARGVEGILRVLRGDEPPAEAQPKGAERDPGAVPPLGLIILFLIFMFLGRGRRRGILPGMILGGPIIWRGGGGGRSDSIFRGGGGSFGGGGASGRW